MTLRDYQQDAVDATMQWVRKTTGPCVIEAPTGAGKSHIIAAICDELFKISKGKRVLVIAPSAELVVQDHGKYVYGVGRPASFFSASVGQKSVVHPVVFGTPGTVKNSLELFDDRYCGIIIDEAHRVTPTLRGIIDSMRGHNPNLRVIGLTATPYRLGDGYIYRTDETGRAWGDEHTKEPYFVRRVYAIEASMLIQRGYLTEPAIGLTSTTYDVSGLTMNSMGKFTSESVDAAFIGKGRLTRDIVGQVIGASQDRQGVMFFAATIRHAEEILAALPADQSRLVTGDTKKRVRQRILTEFKSRQVKYLVNVDVLTTGFDAPHVDVIAILRATESVALLQQIIGRGLRIDEGKKDCLILDYAGNIDQHCPGGDVFAPTVKAKHFKGGGEVDAECPSCKASNLFAANGEALAAGKPDANGYVVDLTGMRLQTEHGPVPAHYGRRCNGLIQVGGQHVRCSYRWTYKSCPACEAENDISARYCGQCKAELVDPNKKLAMDFAKRKKDPTQIQCDEVKHWVDAAHVSLKGNECLRVRVHTAYRKFTAYVQPYESILQKILRHKELHGKPITVTYQKRGDFYRIIDINQPKDINETA
jgi:DNA repair protein RadD